MKTVDFSVVIPVYNGAKTIDELYDRLDKIFRDMNKTYEVIFVDDYSSDKSWEVISGLKTKNPQNIKGIRLTRNFGQHAATFCGLNYAKGEMVITMDDDLQNPPEEIIKLVDKQKETNADLVYGYFPVKKHSRIRNMGSATIKKSTKTILKAPGKGSSFRLIMQDLVKEITTYHQSFVFIDEMVHWYTGNFAFAEVDHHPSGKKSRYSLLKLVRFSGSIVFYSTVIPLKIMIYGGFIASVVSLGFGLYRIYRKVFFNVPHGYTSVIVTIFFSTSVLLFSLGIIGEYLRRLYEAQNRRMPYLIEKIL